MRDKDTILLEEAYNQILVNELNWKGAAKCDQARQACARLSFYWNSRCRKNVDCPIVCEGHPLRKP